MRLNQASDFALRILMYLGQQDTPQTVEKLADALGLAKSHVMKIVARLNRLDLVETTRGRSGGVRLKRPPGDIRLGDVVRQMEPDLGVVACLKPGLTQCSFLPRCAVKHSMARAAEAFLDSLNKETLADILIGTQKARTFDAAE